MNKIVRVDDINSFSVVIPVYNEEGCLEELIQRTLKVCREVGMKFEILLVDDGSKDNSATIMSNASAANPGEIISVILNRNYGQHAAIMAGFSLVSGDLIITLDADLQNPPEEIPKLIAAAKEGNDVVGTVRQKRKDTFFRRFASMIINKITQKATGVNMRDYGCMLRAYRRHIVEAMLQCRETSTFIPVLGNSFARKTCEIPVAHCERAVGESKYSLMKLINLQFNLITCMTTAPLRLLFYLGGVSAIFGFILSVTMIILRLIYGADWGAQGLFSLFSIAFIFIGFLLIGMGLQGEYIGRIYNDVRQRPPYFIEKVIGQKDN